MGFFVNGVELHPAQQWAAVKSEFTFSVNNLLAVVLIQTMVYIFHKSYDIYLKAAREIIRHSTAIFTVRMNDSCWVDSKWPLLHLCRVWHRDVPAATTVR